MHDETTDPAILLTLAARLSDDVLRDLFPSATPQSIRDALRAMSGHPKAGRQTSTGAPPFPDTGGGPKPSPLKDHAGSCILFADGASRGNPGQAGAGLVLLDKNGREIAAEAIYLGRCTNNVAEYQALIAGLETAVRFGCRALRIHLDSELIVRQISGRYKVRNAQLQPLFIKAKGLLNRLDDWSIHHIPRSENARADKLANMGIDGRQQQIGAGA